LTESPNTRAARWIPLLVVGITLNTLGVVLPGLGRLRLVFTGAGLVLLFVALVKLATIARGSDDVSHHP
jgi:hypothetical protein